MNEDHHYSTHDLEAAEARLAEINADPSTPEHERLDRAMRQAMVVQKIREHLEVHGLLQKRTPEQIQQFLLRKYMRARRGRIIVLDGVKYRKVLVQQGGIPVAQWEEVGRA